MAEQKEPSIPVLPWMRDPVDVSLCEECLLDRVPCLDPRLALSLGQIVLLQCKRIEVFAVYLRGLLAGFDYMCGMSTLKVALSCHALGQSHYGFILVHFYFLMLWHYK